MKKLTSYLTATLATLVIAAGLPAAHAGDKQKVVYHVADVEKVQFALGNIRNHIQGVGGPENVEIVLVVHGPAGRMFNDIETTDRVRSMVSALRADGVQFNMCGNTMRAQDVELDDLLPGFVRVDQGGVVRIAELQEEGYVYIRP
jgi:intracellular sulfur oxidation DsrE/DsrF family protein